ncbi:cell wall surface anchor family protein [Bradyrhizobium cosmicum]|uniref:Cell wall surface anchor family protein n=1 Tax=Bradyrhizobium cosmicum TaxID=1404864 RepID=A0AAI8MHR8_9BRAD|nr:cell wall surface anchor family protein [Bradyrhizobium cosmicum]
MLSVLIDAQASSTGGGASSDSSTASATNSGAASSGSSSSSSGSSGASSGSSSGSKTYDSADTNEDGKVSAAEQDAYDAKTKVHVDKTSAGGVAA